MNNWDMRLPGAEMWGPYLEQSPVPPAAFAENPWEALRSFLPESLPTALHTAASWYAAVLTFLVLGAVIALLLGGHADGTLLDLVCAGAAGSCYGRSSWPFPKRSAPRSKAGTGFFWVFCQCMQGS